MAADWKNPLRRTAEGLAARQAAATLSAPLRREVLELFDEKDWLQADWVTDHVFFVTGAFGVGKPLVEQMVAEGLLEWGEW